MTATITFVYIWTQAHIFILFTAYLHAVFQFYMFGAWPCFL